MQALLLSAGYGTRLRPITNTIPKCLVPINGKPLLQIWLENLSDVGISKFLINTHYLHKQVESFIQNSSFRDKITLVYENELLNTGGTLLKNKNFFKKNEPFMLVHADNLCFCDFEDFIRAHKKSKKYDITMMLFETDKPRNCGIVELDENNIVQKFHEKVKNPPSNLANGAIYICNYEIFTFLSNLNKTNIDFSLEVIPKYLGKINAFLNNVYHRDIGSIQSYQKAQIEIQDFLKTQDKPK